MAKKAEISLYISPTSGVPIQRQLIEQIERLVTTGQVEAGAAMPPATDLAKRLAINPANVTRAYQALLDEGSLRDAGGGRLVVTGKLRGSERNQSANHQARRDGPEPAYRGRDAYAFISYAHADVALVYPEITHLQRAGVKVWYDEGISPGASWDDEVAAALSGCTLCIYYVTPRSVASINCRNEVNFCLSRRRRILCVYLEPTELPAGLELNLGTIQAIMRPELTPAAYRSKLTESLAESFPGIAETDSAATLPPTDSPRPNAIAVLPFANRSNDPDNDYLCDGLAEELITAFAGRGDVRIASQIDSFAFKGKNVTTREVGEALRVDNILSGSIQFAGRKVRISVRLDRANDATNLWSMRYDGTLDDVFELQDEIVRQVLGALAD